SSRHPGMVGAAGPDQGGVRSARAGWVHRARAGSLQRQGRAYHHEDEAGAAMNALDFKAATEQAVRGAVAHLKSRGGKAGLTGFCMGGAVAVIGAAKIPELDAAVTFYGLPPPNVASGKDVRVPVQ